MSYYIDVKMDITSKYCYVAGGHLMYPPSSMTYSIVSIQYSVRIAFFFLISMTLVSLMEIYKIPISMLPQRINFTSTMAKN